MKLINETAGMDDLIRSFLEDEGEDIGDSELDVDVTAKDGYIFYVTATVRDSGTEYDLVVDTNDDSVSWG